MATILDKYTKEDCFFSEPFPHIIIRDCLDYNLYNELSKNFPDNLSFKPEFKGENKPYWIYGNELANRSDLWANFIADHVSQEFFDKATEILDPFMPDLDPDYLVNLGKKLGNCTFSLAESGRENNPNNKRTDIVISVAAGINTPCRQSSIIDPPHTDFPQKLFNSLLYMRKEDDDSIGGDLILYECTPSFLFSSKSKSTYEVDQKYLKAAKVVKYSKNVLVLFPQKISAVHGVSARGPTPHTRRYININMESYILKRKSFFNPPRSFFAQVKFIILDLIGVGKLKSILRPIYYQIKK